MRKLVAAICVLSIFSSYLYSQTNFDYGLRLGITNADQDWEYRNIEPSNPRGSMKGTKIGIFFEWNPFSHFSLSSEINYAQKGCYIDMPVVHEDLFGSGEHSFRSLRRVDYIELPFLLKYKLNILEHSVYPIIGIRWDYLIYYKYFPAFPKDSYNSWNFGYTYGFGIELKRLFNTPLLIEVRFNPDQTLMFETDKLAVKNSTIDVTIGVRL